MGLDDDSRVVITQGPACVPSPPPSASQSQKPIGVTPSSTKSAHDSRHARARGCRGGKPDGHGTVTCVHTFPAGLVVSTGSDGTVRDPQRDVAERACRAFLLRCVLCDRVQGVIVLATSIACLLPGLGTTCSLKKTTIDRSAEYP